MNFTTRAESSRGCDRSTEIRSTHADDRAPGAGVGRDSLLGIAFDGDLVARELDAFQARRNDPRGEHQPDRECAPSARKAVVGWPRRPTLAAP